MIFKRKANKKAACRILDGITDVVNNEMLIHGSYVSNVVDRELLHSGAVCGGRHACLLGSAALSARIPKTLAWENFGLAWRRGLDTKPSLKLAAEALDAEAVARTERALARATTVRVASVASSLLAANHTEPGRLAEAYFEHFLPSLYGYGRANMQEGDSLASARTKRAIVSLVGGAIARIEAGLV